MWRKLLIPKVTCSPVFRAALFTIAKTWKQPKCLSTDHWFKKTSYIYTHTHIYIAILVTKKKDKHHVSLTYRIFPGGSDDKESACIAGDLSSIPGLGRSPGEGNNYPLQYSGLENSMGRGAWQAAVHGVAKSQT